MNLIDFPVYCNTPAFHSRGLFHRVFARLFQANLILEEAWETDFDRLQCRDQTGGHLSHHKLRTFNINHTVLIHTVAKNGFFFAPTGIVRRTGKVCVNL